MGMEPCEECSGTGECSMCLEFGYNVDCDQCCGDNTCFECNGDGEE